MAKIKKKHLLRIGFEPGDALKEALVAMEHETFQKKGRVVKLDILQDLLNEPEKYRKHNILGPIVHELVPLIDDAHAPIYPELNSEKVPYKIYGGKGIESGTLDQMDIASRLPVAKAGALMPDAHQGYGLPIGGVLATENAIIPFAVGVDIGCRMCLTVYHLGERSLEKHQSQFKRELIAQTVFGAGKGPKNPLDDEVLHRKEFQEIDIVKNLHGKAIGQIGSSGGGNHFVEFGLVEILEENNEWGVNPGTYMGILSHSGSRGLGSGIANHYTKIAMDKTRLPKEAKHLAWLDLNTEEGMEYWLAMNLAGDYASACHHQIHHKLSKAIGEKPMFMVENHHNFAWKEQLEDGTEVIVHRKGATPAGKGVLGIIPGSMTAPGFIVRGKGNVRSINSASHGAGRVMSRTRAKSSLTRSQLKKELSAHKVTLVGGGLDEAPMAYKDIHTVMESQKDLVEIIGTFQPRIVRMAD
ncbi:MAG: RtcB family protein [Bacteroidetes bacterium]|nr:RtcB family protein [Bacteroidota bacterium]MCB0843053.1 RtcB family protein [Bacteroidota bacterium]